MFSDLSPQEQQRAARAYMAQNSSQASPANMSAIMNQLMSNPDLATAAMNAMNAGDVTNTNSGGNSAGSRINDIMSAVMAADGTDTPAPVARPANLAVAPATNRLPPSKPVELTGDDRVAQAGGPGGRVNGNTAVQAPASAIAESAVDPSMSAIIMSVLGGAGAYGAGRYLGGRTAQLPPEAMPDGGEAVPPVRQAPKQLPPAAGGDVPPVSAIEQRMNALLSGGDIEDAEYKDIEKPRQIDTQKKLSGPKDTDDRDNVKKADGKTINAEDETEEAGVRRTVSKGSTAKEKLKPKVRVK